MFTQGLNYTESELFCDELIHGGQSDWRMPNFLEFASFSAYDLYGNIGIFVGAYTSTRIPNGNHAYLFAAFSGWNIAGSTSFDVFCVRGTSTIPMITGYEESKNFVDNTDGTVTDTDTNLMWQADRTASGFLTWNASIAYCNDLTLASHTDWRLPTAFEVMTGADYGCTGSGGGCVSQGVSEPFIPWGDWVWTSTTTPANQNRAIRLNGNFYFQGSAADKTDTLRAFCVRDM
ncbi:MAG: DUF1566 domain-containing protein [Candidatus Woesearchaeota archaeon]